MLRKLSNNQRKFRLMIAAAFLLGSTQLFAVVGTGAHLSVTVSSNDCLPPVPHTAPHEFHNLTINAGVVLTTCSQGDVNNGLYIRVTNTLTMGNNSVIRNSNSAAGAYNVNSCAPAFISGMAIPEFAGTIWSPGGAAPDLIAGVERNGALGVTYQGATGERGGEGGGIMCSGRNAGNGPGYTGAAGAANSGGWIIIEADQFINNGGLVEAKSTTTGTNGSGNFGSNTVAFSCTGGGDCGPNNAGTTYYAGAGGGGGAGGGVIIIKARYINSSVTSAYDTQGSAGGVASTPSQRSQGSGGRGAVGGHGGRGLDGPVIFLHSDGTSYIKGLNDGDSNKVSLFRRAGAGATADFAIVLSDDGLPCGTTMSPPCLSMSTSLFGSFSTSYVKFGEYIPLAGFAALQSGTQRWLDLNGVRYNTQATSAYQLFKKFGVEEVYFDICAASDIAPSCTSSTRRYFCKDPANCADVAAGGSASTKMLKNVVPPSGTNTNWFHDWNASQTGNAPMYSSVSTLPYFKFPDGPNRAQVTAVSRGNDSIYVDKTIYFDQYAPCDDVGHGCTLAGSQGGNGRDINVSGMTIKTAIFNSDNFILNMNLSDGLGSGVKTITTAPASIRYMIAKQNNTNIWVRNTGGTLTDIAPSFGNVNNYKDQSCDALFSAGPWVSLVNTTETYTSGGLIFDTTSGTAGSTFAGLMTSLQSALNAASISTDGTYYAIFCLADKSDNQSRIIIPSNTSYWAGANAEYSGTGTNGSLGMPFTVGVYDPYTSDRNKVGTIYNNAYFPSLTKRLFFDRPPEDLVGCISDADPCIGDLFSANPAFVDSSYIEPSLTQFAGIQRISYLPAGYTLNNIVTVGVRLPYDHSGLKYLYYDIVEVNTVGVETVVKPTTTVDIGTRAPFCMPNQNVTDSGTCSSLTPVDYYVGGSLVGSYNWVTSATIYPYPRVNCAALNSANSFSGAVADACFEVTHPVSNKPMRIRVWFEDYAGNISASHYVTGTPGGMFKRTFFKFDALAPLPPKDLSLAVNDGTGDVTKFGPVNTSGTPFVYYHDENINNGADAGFDVANTSGSCASGTGTNSIDCNATGGTWTKSAPNAHLATDVMWTNVSTIKLKFKTPPNPYPATGFKYLYYMFSANYDPVNPTALPGDTFNPASAVFTIIGDGICTPDSSKQTQEECEAVGSAWDQTTASNPSGAPSGSCSSGAYKNEKECTKPVNQGGPGASWTKNEIVKTILYNTVGTKDGCKNMYLWYSDGANNNCTVDYRTASPVGCDIQFTAVPYCFDNELPGKVGVSYVSGNSSAVFPATGPSSAVASHIKFYDYTTLLAAPTAYLDDSSKKFDPTSNDNMGDRARNSKNKNITRTRDENNNLFSSGNEGHRLTLAWVPVEDANDPNNGDKSGLKANPYRLCWSKQSGDCEYFVDVDKATPANTDPTLGHYSATGNDVGNKYVVYTMDATTNKWCTNPAYTTSGTCTGAGAQWTTEMGSLTTGEWYFMIRTYDKAGNISTSNPVTIIIDNTYPCWTDPSSGTIATNIANGFHRGKSGSNACTLTSLNGIDTLDFSAATGPMKDAAGLSGFQQVQLSSIISYFKCGDGGGELCDDFNDIAAAVPTGHVGGVVGRFTVGAVDNAIGGSDFDTTQTAPLPKNVQFGVGIDVWSACNREIVYWMPVGHLMLNNGHSLANGQVDYNFHLFEKGSSVTPMTPDTLAGFNSSTHCNSNVNDDRDTIGYYKYYVANPPVFGGDGLDGFASGTRNIDRVRFTVEDGREVIRNIYVRVRDIANNWSPFDFRSDVGYTKQSVIVDTKPPARMFAVTTTGNYIEVIRQSNDAPLLRVIDNSNDGIADYMYSPTTLPVGYTTNIHHVDIKPINENTFKVKMVKPIDMSTVKKGYYKIGNPPTGPADFTASFDASGDFFNLAVTANFPDVYVWLEDKSLNPSTLAVPAINNYYRDLTSSGACDFTNIGVNNMYPAVTVNGRAYAAGAGNPCRVIRLQLPYDNTAPVWPNVTTTTPAGSYAPTPYIINFWGTGVESTNTGSPTLHYFPAVDNVATRESGLRSEAIDGVGNRRYVLCLDPLAPPACSNPFAADVASDIPSIPVLNPDTSDSGARAYAHTVSGLAAGTYFFSVKAYDRAGNQSGSSPARQILVDTQAPCTNGDFCSMTARSVSAPVDREWSTNHVDGGIKLVLIGQDIHSGVKDFQAVEQYHDGTNCVTRYLTWDNANSTYRMKRLVNNASAANTAFNQANEIRRYTTPVSAGVCQTTPNFGLVGGTSVIDNYNTNETIIPFPTGSTTLTINYANVNSGFIISKDQDGSQLASGTKYLFIRYRDNAGNWSPAIPEQIVYDLNPPGTPLAVTANPAGWTRQNVIQIQVQIPTNDQSNDGPPPFGIDSIYYVVDNAVTYPNAINVKIADAIALGPNLYAFNINIATGNTGEKRVYVWLMDVLLNKAPDPNTANTFVDIYPDVTRPFPPGAPIFDSNEPVATPLITWAASAEPDPVKDVGLYSDVAANPPLVPTTVNDSIENLPVVETYKLCWGLIDGQCPNFRWVSTTTYQFNNPPQLPTPEEVGPGNWYFFLYAYDRVGNRSLKSPSTSHSVIPQVPTLTTTTQGAFFKKVVLPVPGLKMGNEGDYTFTVLYAEGGGKAPDINDHHIMIDLNGNGVYDGNEVFEMNKVTAATATGDDNALHYDGGFVNGELYKVTLPLPFVKETFGNLRFRFKFKATGINAIKLGTAEFDPALDQYISIQRYDSSKVRHFEVYNNVKRPNSKEPVVIILQPPKDPSTPVSVKVFDRSGRQVKKVLDGVAYSSLPRDYLYWDTTNEENRPVASGMYYVFVDMEGLQSMKKVIIVR